MVLICGESRVVSARATGKGRNIAVGGDDLWLEHHIWKCEVDGRRRRRNSSYL
jgi:hypothetical protein